MSDPISCSVLIQAPPDRVLRHFTDPRLLVTWMGHRAELSAQPGGRFAVDVEQDQIRGEFVTVEPNRLVFTWGFAGAADLPPGASTVEVTFTERDGGTLVELVHSGLPPSRASEHEPGWTHFLGALSAVA